METILLIAITGTLNVVCFFVGAKVGQMVVKEEKIEMPTLNPIQAIKEHQEKREMQKETDKLDTILKNIEIYDGTGNNQKDVPY